jgi:D-arginine dehydrogenase
MAAMASCDVLVVGGGMAGVSIGFELAADFRVMVVDMERVFAFHTTGRSAAMFLETYGSQTIRALTTASREYLETATDGRRILSSLPMLYVARPGRGSAITALHAQVHRLAPDVELLDVDETVRMQPMLRRGAVELALLEPGAMEIDVAGLHAEYARGLRGRGGATVVDSRVASAERAGGAWVVTMSDGRIVNAEVVVNAAGAWADDVATRFGVLPVGLRPLRRSAFVVEAPPGASGPMIAEIDDAFYVKPDAGKLLCSPADETVQAPADARPDEFEIARAIEAINEMTTLAIRRVTASWAGLRTFAADRNPVVGFDPDADGFFWFAGQGGYGIQIAPALARTGAALVRGAEISADISQRGLAAADLAPGRSMTAWAT